MFGTLLGMFQCLSILVTPHEHSFHTSLPEDPAFARLLRYKWSGGLFTLSCVLKPLELLPGALHVRKRSQGGSDFDLDWLVSLCRVCHAQTDAPYVTGRLVVTPLGSGRFEWAVVYAHSKRDVPKLATVTDGPCFKNEQFYPRGQTRLQHAGYKSRQRAQDTNP